MQQPKTLFHLILLLLIPIAGIFLLIAIHTTFNNILKNLDEKTQNLQTKISIGEYIVNDLHKLRSDFYELATTTTNHFGREIVQARLNKRLDSIKEAVAVLQNGGVLTRTLQLNLVNQNQTTRTFVYKKENLSKVSMEAIDVSPKLFEFEQMNKKLIGLLIQLQQYKKERNEVAYTKLSSSIKRFYKSTPAFFNRMIENTSRLLYEGEIELSQLKQQIETEKNYYKKIELILSFFTIFMILIIGYIVAKQIMKNHKELEEQERYSRGILDAQPNIIVVSNGEHMIDANPALIDFFKNYHSFEDFSSKHACICDYFEDIGEEEYVVDKEYDEGLWYEHILALPHQIHKVAMNSGTQLHYFTIRVLKKHIDEDRFIVIIALNDITKELLANQKLQQLNNNLESMVNEKTSKLKDLNDNLENRIQEELAKNRDKDKKMIQQSRYAALGEMIANIAHQWRQPLSAISSTASGTNLQMDLDMINKEEIQKAFKSISKYVDYLNQTIEDFRAFFKKDKNIVRFDLNEILQKSINITHASYKNAQISISIIHEDDDLDAIGYPNELAQVFINILNNAQDALKENQIFDKQVLIKTRKENNHNILQFFDNAGGIQEEIMTKIFDPYFTTKHQSQGTGIGLYMSKDIIEKNMKGRLGVKNTTFQLNGKEYYGASFKIAIPVVDKYYTNNK